MTGETGCMGKYSVVVVHRNMKPCDDIIFLAGMALHKYGQR